MSHRAGAGETQSRGPLAGCDRGAGHGRGNAGPYARFRGQIPEGPSSTLQRAPFHGGASEANDATRRRGMGDLANPVSEAAA